MSDEATNSDDRSTEPSAGSPSEFTPGSASESTSGSAPAVLSGTDAAAAVDGLGWRVVLSTLLASVPVDSLARAADVARLAVEACGADADGHLRVDLRPDRVELAVHDRTLATHTARDVELVRAVDAALRNAGYSLAPPTGRRPVQMLEVAIDALDIPAIRPFWAAVLGYDDEPGTDALVDPLRQGPSFWFQQMDEPRPQRNRIHFDVVVAHDEAERRIQAALDAGGAMLSNAAARAFWILADAEGNEVCVCTWQDRD
ncbi:VOC family protein [uncultured Jatrophihabitans sp.]|uniref:VOC family protein n=1 Tax=uncultured Jatrophihabitans sp. TaxID=1610747 RepID=UPI0035C98B89